MTLAPTSDSHFHNLRCFQVAYLVYYAVVNHLASVKLFYQVPFALLIKFCGCASTAFLL